MERPQPCTVDRPVAQTFGACPGTTRQIRACPGAQKPPSSSPAYSAPVGAVRDAGRHRVALGAIPRPTRRVGTGLCYRVPVGNENPRVHRRFLEDIEAADTTVAAV